MKAILILLFSISPILAMADEQGLEACLKALDFNVMVRKPVTVKEKRDGMRGFEYPAGSEYLIRKLQNGSRTVLRSDRMVTIHGPGIGSDKAIGSLEVGLEAIRDHGPSGARAAE